MTEPKQIASQTPYYEGRKLPLDSLSADEFEKFVFSCLLCIQDTLGLRIIGKPSGSGDGGFDVQGETVYSQRGACVQCKRQNAPLSTPQVATELAKVAATSALEGSDIGEHRFICTGGVRQKLLGQLRETSRQELALEAGEQLVNASNGELASLRTRLEEHRLDPRQVAESYVSGLDLLSAWGVSEFDAALSPRWNDVLTVIERHFKIATLVREHPRAFFDRAAYIADHRDFTTVVEPRLTSAALPEGISASSAADPIETAPPQQREIKSLYDLMSLEVGTLAVLFGSGGIGKSTTLQLVRAEALRTMPDSTLPILISLVSYVPGGLDRAIQQELGVDHGTWRSLPDRILLLCDGLNECPSANVAPFLDELRPLLQRKHVACILSTRELTRHKTIVLPQSPVGVRLEGLTPIAIQRIATNVLRDGSADDFIAMLATV
ncbi:hypothetical protein [Paludibacterium purpuratum]|uniref:Uncharacterized protein n=1 Tax=Paludibacterium purpuratum TaxID=1144873 RepID=A0A4R7AUK3_9NEIS|nr:hypothetical protein [Paludibacterium purpuratum]TDR70647.1 hypothetical protein DFP86_12249 [Paludibacterium purpuratum]